MDEFNNRIDAQRLILTVVNRGTALHEELVGLSRKAIERWLTTNYVDNYSNVAQLLFALSGQLFFLANKSQQQITEDYSMIVKSVAAMTEELRAAIKSFHSARTMQATSAR